MFKNITYLVSKIWLAAVVLVGAFALDSQLYAYSTTTYNGCIVEGPIWNQREYCCNNRTGAWSGAKLTLQRSTVSFPNGNAYTNNLVTAWSRWNNGPSRFVLGTTSTGSVGLQNGYSETWLSKSSSILGGAPGITYNYFDYHTCYYSEADVIFSSTISKTSSENGSHLPYSGFSQRNFIGLTLHEFGHAMGLGHENRYYNIMGGDFSHLTRNLNTTYYGHGENGGEGLQVIYSKATTTRADLGITGMRHSGTDGEYSTHRFPRIYVASTGSQAASAGTIANQPAYLVTVGQQIDAEFTLENNGTTDTHNSVKVAYYISTNTDITSSDRQIATYSYNLSRGTPNEVKVRLTIPSNLSRNKAYYLGASLDYDNLITETTSANNRAYIPIKTRP